MLRFEREQVLVPVDLNSLLYHAERTIAALRTFRARSGDDVVARRFLAMAEARRRSLLAVAWDEADGFFYDVRWRTGERVRGAPGDAAAARARMRIGRPSGRPIRMQDSEWAEGCYGDWGGGTEK